jgi:hypothetical protein
MEPIANATRTLRTARRADLRAASGRCRRGHRRPGPHPAASARDRHRQRALGYGRADRRFRRPPADDPRLSRLRAGAVRDPLSRQRHAARRRRRSWRRSAAAGMAAEPCSGARPRPWRLGAVAPDVSAGGRGRSSRCRCRAVAVRDRPGGSAGRWPAAATRRSSSSRPATSRTTCATTSSGGTRRRPDPGPMSASSRPGWPSACRRATRRPCSTTAAKHRAPSPRTRARSTCCRSSSRSGRAAIRPALQRIHAGVDDCVIAIDAYLPPSAGCAGCNGRSGDGCDRRWCHRPRARNGGARRPRSGR